MKLIFSFIYLLSVMIYPSHSVQIDARDQARVVYNAEGGIVNLHYQKHHTPLKAILSRFLNSENFLTVRREDLADLKLLTLAVNGRINTLQRTGPDWNDGDQVTGLHISWSTVLPLQEQEKQDLREIFLAISGIPSLQTLKFEMDWPVGDTRGFAGVSSEWATTLGNRIKTLIDHCLDQLPYLIALDLRNCRLNNTDFQSMMDAMAQNKRNQFRSLKIYHGNQINFTQTFFDRIRNTFSYLVEIDVELKENEFHWLLEKARSLPRSQESVWEEFHRSNPHHMNPYAIKELLTTIAINFDGNATVTLPLLWPEYVTAYVDEFFDFIINENTMGKFYCALDQPKISHLHQLLDIFNPDTRNHCDILEYLMIALKPLHLSEEKDYHHQSLLTKLAHRFLFSAVQDSRRQETLLKLVQAYPELHWETLKAKFLPLLEHNPQAPYLLQSQTGIRGFTGPHYRQLYPAGRFQPEDSNHNNGFNRRNGSHMVAFLKNQGLEQRQLCFKKNPEFPMIEQAVLHLMYRLFKYPGVPFSEMIRMGGRSAPGDDIFLVSVYVEGERLDDVMEHHPHKLNQLDAQRMSELIVMSILTNPEDGRLENYIVTPSDLDPTRYKIVAIDNDHSFAAAIPQHVKAGWTKMETKGDCVLFTLGIMQDPIHPSVIKRLLEINLKDTFKTWIEDLKRGESDYRQLFTNEDKRQYGTTTSLELPLNYARLMRVYEKLQDVQSFIITLKETPEQITGLKLLKEVEAYLGDRYDQAFECATPLERFTRTSGRHESTMNRQNMLDILDPDRDSLKMMQRVLSALERQEQQAAQNFRNEAAEFKTLTSKEQAERFATINRKNQANDYILAEEEQRNWLELIKPYTGEWQSLLFRGYAALGSAWFNRTNLYNLTILELTDCRRVSDEVFLLISLSSPSLRALTIINLPSIEKIKYMNKTVFGSWRATQEPVVFQELQSLALENNTNLKEVALHSPKLKTLTIKNCQQLQSIEFPASREIKEITLEETALLAQKQKVRDLETQQPSLRKISLQGEGIAAECQEFFKTHAEEPHFIVSLFCLSEEQQRTLAQIYHAEGEINLSNQHLGDDAAIALSELLKINKRIHRLSLESNQIGESGARALLEALRTNPEIHGCDVRGNWRISHQLLLDLWERVPPEMPLIATGHEAVYRQFFRGKLIYKPDSNSDAGKIELPIGSLLNPLEGTFSLSGCGDTGRYLSINTGYKKGRIAANKDKVEIWFAPRFMIERASPPQYRTIMDQWRNNSATTIGIFWSWGNEDNLDIYDYLIDQAPAAISDNNLYEKYRSTHACSHYVAAQALMFDHRFFRIGPRLFHVHFVN